MGIAGSIVDHTFFEKYLGMRVETIDMTEILRRIERDIYDPRGVSTCSRLDKRSLPTRKRCKF